MTMQTQYGEEGVASTEEDDKALLETVSFLDLFIEEPYLELQFLNKLKEASLISKAQLDDELISTIRTNLPELTKEESSLFLPPTINLICYSSRATTHIPKSYWDLAILP